MLFSSITELQEVEGECPPKEFRRDIGCDQLECFSLANNRFKGNIAKGMFICNSAHWGH